MEKKKLWGGNGEFSKKWQNLIKIFWWWRPTGIKRYLNRNGETMMVYHHRRIRFGLERRIDPIVSKLILKYQSYILRDNSEEVDNNLRTNGAALLVSKVCVAIYCCFVIFKFYC